MEIVGAPTRGSYLASDVFRDLRDDGVADVLAGESSAEDVNGWQVVGTAFSDVGESLGTRKVFLQDAATVGVNFNLPHSSNSCAFKSKIETPDAREKRTVRKHYFGNLFMIRYTW